MVSPEDFKALATIQINGSKATKLVNTKKPNRIKVVAGSRRKDDSRLAIEYSLFQTPPLDQGERDDNQKKDHG